MSIKDLFHRFSTLVAAATGSPFSFILAVFIIAVWGITGPAFDFSDTWQLVINTGTTIVTFLMVFLIQNTQNRDARAMHLKLDELIRSIKGARTELVDLEELTDEELDLLETEFRRLHNESYGHVLKDLHKNIKLAARNRAAAAPNSKGQGRGNKSIKKPNSSTHSRR
ncbi:low affinity iron permease family protein [Candidatus Peregrinibacteria bacterium]|nr:MAG: low affinity iron permease family protein [Candidatus Peregrinibacteria bacterium]